MDMMSIDEQRMKPKCLVSPCRGEHENWPWMWDILSWQRVEATQRALEVLCLSPKYEIDRRESVDRMRRSLEQVYGVTVDIESRDRAVQEWCTQVNVYLRWCGEEELVEFSDVELSSDSEEGLDTGSELELVRPNALH